MAKFFITILLLYYSVKANSENEYEVIDEFVPKLIYSNMPDKIFKYIALCGEKRNETNIYFQAMTNGRNNFNLFFYDDFTKIQKDKYGYYTNYISITSISEDKPVITFNNKICNKDYYFVIPKRGQNVNIGEDFIQITIFNDETNIFKLSPFLSMDYTLFPRKSEKEECLYYSFNESKYVEIDYNGLIRIEENGHNISDFYKTNKTQFKKDLEYKIYYTANPIEPPTIYPYKPAKSPAIHLHFYNEESFFKYNKKDFPIMLFGRDSESYFEIDISDYNVGDYILFHAFSGKNWIIKYQYKNDFKNNNFINLGEYMGFNFIPIQKTKNDSSLILYIRYTSNENLLSMINILKDNVMEITSEINSELNGPKFLFLDYNKFNNLESFAFESNKTFYFYIQDIGYIKEMKKEYNYINISKQNENKPLLNNRIFIYLNSTDNLHLVIKKLNFSIKENTLILYGHEYFDLCQGEEHKKELYYYKPRNRAQLFISVFGNFDLFFINEKEVKTLSDFDFGKINETIEFIDSEGGYLKIVCKEPTLIKHTYIEDDYKFYENPILIPGKRYYISPRHICDNIKLSDTLIGKNISLKFSIFGAKNNTQVKLNLNGSEYILSNDNKSLEFELKSYQENSSYLINYDLEKSMKEEMIIEIVVVTKEDLSDYQIKNLNESFGNLIIDKGKGIIIKVPKDYDESYYNYSIIQNYLRYYDGYYIDISYNKIEFMALKIKNEYTVIKNIYEYSNFVPLFKVNPYSYIPNNNIKSDDKFFYILLFNYGDSKEHIFIKKPKLFTNINLNKINTFPQLKGEDEKYYYKIIIPNEVYDSLLIQTNKNINTTFSFEKDNKIYPLDKSFLLKYDLTFDSNYSLHYIPIYKNKNIYLNYYGNSFSDGFVRFMSGNEVILDKIDDNFMLDLDVMQKEKENKLILKLNSYSYYAKRPIIYYLIINEPRNDEKIIFSALTEERNFDKYKMMLKVEDNGENEHFRTEVEINKELIDYGSDETYNYIIIVPVDKETNLAYMHLETYTSFKYKNINYTYIIIIIIVIVILILIIIIGILLYKKKKKEKGNNIEDEIGNKERILSDN